MPQGSLKGAQQRGEVAAAEPLNPHSENLNEQEYTGEGWADVDEQHCAVAPGELHDLLGVVDVVARDWGLPGSCAPLHLHSAVAFYLICRIPKQLLSARMQWESFQRTLRKRFQPWVLRFKELTFLKLLTSRKDCQASICEYLFLYDKSAILQSAKFTCVGVKAGACLQSNCPYIENATALLASLFLLAYIQGELGLRQERVSDAQ